MKKSFITIPILIFLAFVTQSIQAQCSFTLSDLEITSLQTQSEFEIFILGRGYYLTRTLDKPSCRKEYSCDSTNKNLINAINCSYGSGKNIVVTYTTSSKEQYQSVKDSLTIKGYSLSKEESTNITDSKSIWSYYTKGNTQIILYDIKDSNKILYVEEIRKLE